MIDIKTIKQNALKILLKGMLKPMLVFLFISVLSLVINMYLNLYTISNIYISVAVDLVVMLFILKPFNLGAQIFILDFSRGNAADIGLIFDGFKYIKKLIPISVIMLAFSVATQYFFMRIDTFNWDMTQYLLALIVYLLIIFLISSLFSLFNYVVYDNRDLSAFGALFLSIRLIYKHFFKYIKLQFSFILWFMGAFLTGGLLLIFLIPYMETANALFYESIIDKKAQAI